jgi:hypothetical protein
MWLFAFDDMYCDEGRYSHDPSAMAVLVAEMIRIAETGVTTSSSPCARALADLRRRLNDLASAVQIARWVHAMRSYLNFQVWESAHRASGRVPTLDEYCVARIRNGSMEVCAMALDISGGYEVAAHEIARPDVHALTEMACCLVRSRQRHRFLSQGTRAQQGRPQPHRRHRARAQDRSSRCATGGRRPSRLGAEALHRAGSADLTTAESRRSTLRRKPVLLDQGNLDWSSHTGRYRRNGQQTVRVVSHADVNGGSFSPPPGIAWWWSQLATREGDAVLRRTGS